jgi:hypothetical protein
MVASSAGEEGWGRAERRRRWCSWVGVIGVVVGDASVGGRRDRTDQVGLERSLVMSSLEFGVVFLEGVEDSFTECSVGSFVDAVVEL